jgi:hypothetical protein
MVKFLFKILFLIFILYLVYKIFLDRSINIDKCLDNGWAWDYPQNICVEGKNIPVEGIECLAHKMSWNIKTKKCEE